MMTTPTPTNDDDLLALIAAHDQLHRNAPPMGLDEIARAEAIALFDRINRSVPVTLRGVLAMLEFADWEDDASLVSAVTGLRAVVERRALQEPPLLPPGASALQKLIVVEWRIRSMGIKISDAADDFKYWFEWLEKHDASVCELAAGMDDLISEAYRLYDRMDAKASALLDRINKTPPITSLSDAIALLEMDDPPMDAVIAGLRAIAEKGGAA
jgi:hypothetical protein